MFVATQNYKANPNKNKANSNYIATNDLVFKICATYVILISSLELFLLNSRIQIKAFLCLNLEW